LAEMTDFLTFEPVMPRSEDIRAENMVLRYDRDADFLHVHFFGIRPGVMYDIDDHVLIRIDPDSHEVVGLQIEGYLIAAVFERPYLLDLAPAAGIPDDEIAEIRRRMEPEAVAQATVRFLLESLDLQSA
jgi:hypothetical protein